MEIIPNPPTFFNNFHSERDKKEIDLWVILQIIYLWKGFTLFFVRPLRFKEAKRDKIYSTFPGNTYFLTKLSLTKKPKGTKNVADILNKPTSEISFP